MDLESEFLLASSSMSSAIEANVFGLRTGFLLSPKDAIGGVSALDEISVTGFGVD